MSQFKAIKEHLQKQPPIRIQGLSERPTESIKEFMEQLFAVYFRKNDTIYNGNNHLQTERGKRRSFGDIYRIMYFYFPKITVTTVYDTLYKLISEDKVLSAICSVTGCRVYRGTRQDKDEKGCVNSSLMDEYKTDLTPYIDKYDIMTQLDSTWGTDYTTANLKYISL